jgi:hypothetical protein
LINTSIGPPGSWVAKASTLASSATSRRVDVQAGAGASEAVELGPVAGAADGGVHLLTTGCQLLDELEANPAICTGHHEAHGRDISSSRTGREANRAPSR